MPILPNLSVCAFFCYCNLSDAASNHLRYTSHNTRLEHCFFYSGDSYFADKPGIPVNGIIFEDMLYDNDISERLSLTGVP